jgi:hypothetical protein
MKLALSNFAWDNEESELVFNEIKEIGFNNIEEAIEHFEKMNIKVLQVFLLGKNQSRFPEIKKLHLILY